MSGLIGGLIEAVADFVTDIWVLRRQRSAGDRSANSWAKDAGDVVLFDGLTWVLSILAFVCFLAMLLVFDLPVWISLAPVLAGVVYVGYRWFALVRAE